MSDLSPPMYQSSRERLYRALSAGNQAVVRARSRAELLAGICRAVVDVAGFPGAWVAPLPSGDLLPLPARAGEVPEECGWFFGHCLQPGEPYRLPCAQLGRLAMVYPAYAGGVHHGALVVLDNSAPPLHLDNLFREMAMDLGYGLRNLALEAHDAELAAAMALSSDIVLLADAGLHISYANHSAGELLGARAAVGAPLGALLPAEQRRVAVEALKQARESGVWRGEGHLLAADGEELPVSLVVLVHRDTNGAVERYSLIARDHKAEQQLRRERDAHMERVESGLVQLVRTLSQALELRDAYTAGHQRRVADIAVAIAERLGLDSEQCRGIQLAGLIHDVGKLSVPAEFLAKPARLTEAEFSIIKTHAAVGYELVRPIEFPWPLAEMVHQHHERMDGSGYPLGLRGDQIGLGARILAVADVVEAMTSHRPYRPALGLAAALEEIRRYRGRWYDPAVVDACLSLYVDVEAELRMSAA